jgi:hypothetical protein
LHPVEGGRAFKPNGGIYNSDHGKPEEQEQFRLNRMETVRYKLLKASPDLTLRKSKTGGLGDQNQR